ncbi:sensor histidine kinase [Bacillus sp. T33-2]|nr:sensor histidine kinase [Bacillus sp. T33-2]
MIPVYFLLQEPPAKIYPGLVLVAMLLVMFRQVYWTPRISLILIAGELAITLLLGYLFNPVYLYIVFIFSNQIVRLPLRWMYVISVSFAVSALYLMYDSGMFAEFYIIMIMIPPLFGGSILPFIMRASLKYKEMNERLELTVKELEIKSREKMLAEESKKRMLADISHDLKTPITTIQGYSKALYEGMADNPEQAKKYLKYIHDKSIRVATLIDELFMFSKLDNPDYATNKVERDVCEFVREVIVEYFDLFAEKEMQLNIEIPDTKILHRFDQQLMYRAVSNLLENALKYNPVKTDIFVGLTSTAHEITIKIGDSGTVIPDELAKDIFEPFVRGDRSRKEDGGTGLGLAIAKKIAEVHDGKLVLDTKPERGVKAFVFELPRIR